MGGMGGAQYDSICGSDMNRRHKQQRFKILAHAGNDGVIMSSVTCRHAKARRLVAMKTTSPTTTSSRFTNSQRLLISDPERRNTAVNWRLFIVTLTSKFNNTVGIFAPDLLAKSC